MFCYSPILVSYIYKLYNYYYYCLPSLRAAQYIGRYTLYYIVYIGTHPLQSSTPSCKYYFFLPVYIHLLIIILYAQHYIIATIIIRNHRLRRAMQPRRRAQLALNT